MKLLILVECEPDSILIETLYRKSRQIKHARGKGNIANILHRSNNNIALIDEDPGCAQPDI